MDCYVFTIIDNSGDLMRTMVFTTKEKAISAALQDYDEIYQETLAMGYSDFPNKSEEIKNALMENEYCELEEHNCYYEINFCKIH